MKPEDLDLSAAVAERARILGWRSLDAKAWHRVQRLTARIAELREEERKAAPLRIAEKVAQFPRIAKVGGR